MIVICSVPTKINTKVINMEKFLIEIRNGGDRASCLRSIQSFLSTRTHFVTSVEWGCIEREHKVWLIIKTGNSEDAMRIIPAAYRQKAKITSLQKFTGKEIDENMVEYPGVISAKERVEQASKDFNATSI